MKSSRFKSVVVIVFGLCCSQQAVLGRECNSYSAEKENEGFRECVYRDPLGIPTIGVGCNLRKANARMQIERVGANYDKVLSGEECLSESQIERLFRMDMSFAVSCVSSWLPNWSALGPSQQSALADMAFNMGCEKLKSFTKMKAALMKRPPDYATAAMEMRNSHWCGQVGRRCRRDVACMTDGVRIRSDL